MRRPDLADKRLFVWGVISLGAGLLTPLVTVYDFGIIRLICESTEINGGGALLLAAIRLVILNTVRVLPLYLGTLLIAEGFGLLPATGRTFIHYIKLLLVFLLVPFHYSVIDYLYGVAYDFGVPSVSLLFMILIVHNIKHMTRSLLHKLILFALLLFGIEWLDVIPMLTAFGFGRGEISSIIKQFAAVNNTERILNIVGISMFVIFVANSFITARLLQLYTREIVMVEQELRMKQMEVQLRLQAIQNRSLKEMQSLVHDLKTPLTTIQGLAGVIALSDTEPQHKEYANYICSTVDKMSTMIGELLEDDVKQVVLMRDIIDYAAAHIPRLNTLLRFEVVDKAGEALVQVNKIKMARAIGNLLENALDAVDLKTGVLTVILRHDSQRTGFIEVVVQDNGQGLSEEQQACIWAGGFSTKDSSGLGLPFVRDVVENNGGSVTIASAAGEGTSVTIALPGWKNCSIK